MRSETHGIILNTSDAPSGGYPQGIIVPDIDSLIGSQIIEDAHSYLGHWAAIRRKIRPDDGIERCPDCYDEVYEQSTNPRCTTCWGTTFVGGYFPTEITKAIFHSMNERIELTKTGLVRIVVPQVTIGSSPIVKEGDVIARIAYNEIAGIVESVGDRYWIREIEKIEIAPSYDLAGQKFQITELQYNDPIWNLPI